MRTFVPALRASRLNLPLSGNCVYPQNAVDVPVIASDFIVYPYQIHQARLAGADAVRLIVPGLPLVDLVYFHKIAQAVGLQVVVAVSSKEQMLTALTKVPGIKIVSINNRNLANWALDKSRAKNILEDAEVQQKIKETGVLVMAEAGIKSHTDIGK